MAIGEILIYSDTTIIHLVVLSSEATAFAREETWTREKSGVGDAVILYHHVSILNLLARAISYCYRLCLLYSLKVLTHFVT